MNLENIVSVWLEHKRRSGRAENVGQGFIDLEYIFRNLVLILLGSGLSLQVFDSNSSLKGVVVLLTSNYAAPPELKQTGLCQGEYTTVTLRTGQQTVSKYI